MPVISVVIPTRNRREELLRTLRVLERQTPPDDGFEVVVADNGSTDGTAETVAALAAQTGISVRLVEEPRPGPAAARNRGVKAARGEVILFLGDDTAPATSEVVAAHAELHRRASDQRFAVLGRVDWSDRQPMTPFVEWLGRAGFQFEYSRLQPGAVRARDAFWTAHLSLGRELLAVTGGFDERFPMAMVEDIELGLRLEDAGIRLHYHPELLALHTHPTDLTRSLERLYAVGRSSALLHEIHPTVDPPGMPRPKPVRSRLLRLATPLLRAVTAAPAPRLVHEGAWRALHLAAYARGFRDGPVTSP